MIIGHTSIDSVLLPRGVIAIYFYGGTRKGGRTWESPKDHRPQ